VHAADIQDRDWTVDVLMAIRRRFPRLRHAFAGGGYVRQKLRDAIACDGGWTIEIIRRSDAAKASGFCHGDWSASAHLHGSDDAGAWQRIKKRLSPHQPLGRWLCPFACSPDQPQDPATLEKLVNRALSGRNSGTSVSLTLSH